MRVRHAWTSAIGWLLWWPALAAAALHHDLVVTVDPDQHRIEVQDTISAGGDAIGRLEFVLHPALAVEVMDAGARLVELSPAARDSDTAGSEVLVPRRYRVEPAPGQQRVTLRYDGPIMHALQQQGEEYARSFSETPGMIAPQGVFLSASSLWYPQFSGQLVSFDMRLQLPAGERSTPEAALMLRLRAADGALLLPMLLVTTVLLYDTVSRSPASVRVTGDDSHMRWYFASFSGDRSGDAYDDDPNQRVPDANHMNGHEE